MATRTQTIVFAHDVAAVRSRTARDLDAQGLHVLEASSPREVTECLRTISADCVVIGELAAGMTETLRWLAEIHQADRAIRIIFAPVSNGAVSIPDVPRNDPEWGTRQLVGQSRAIRLVREYLEKVAARLRKKKIKAHAVVVYGKDAVQICEYARKNKLHLIAMATHGRSGFSRWALGSVADKVLSCSRVPVLLVRVS
jgi:nucleotide-binding universal stress UspA family protein